MVLGPEQLVVEFADSFQSGLEFAVVAQPLLDQRLLFGGEADLLGAPTGIADGQNPDEMAFATGTDGATGAMANAATQQGAAENLSGGGEGGGNLVASFDDRLFAHLKQ